MVGEGGSAEASGRNLVFTVPFVLPVFESILAHHSCMSQCEVNSNPCCSQGFSDAAGLCSG